MTHAWGEQRPTIARSARHLKKDATLKAVLSTITGLALSAIIATPALVWVPGVLVLLLIFIDTGTGMIAAAYEGNFWSKASWQGAGAKMGVYLIFAVPCWFAGYIVQEHLKNPMALGFVAHVRLVIAVTEIASIRENVRRLQKKRLKLGPIYKLLMLGIAS